MSSYSIPSTPFPNHLLDAVLPTLKDTEWRLLCVIVRQTLGWQAGKSQRKAGDWLTHSQLKARTGRSSEALSHALDVLVRRHLVEVWDDQGRPLLTPAARRQTAGRLTFRLGPHALRPPQEAQGLKVPKSEERISTSEKDTPESEIRKAKTTKETQYKNTPYGGEPRGSTAMDRDVPGQALQAKQTAKPANPEVRRFLMAYREKFVRYSARGEPPPLSWGRDGKLVKALLDQYDYDRLEELLEGFFQSEDAWVKKRGYALTCFPTLLPQLLMDKGSRKRAASPIEGPHVILRPDPASGWKQASSLAISKASLFERYPDLARRVRPEPP